MKKKVKTKKLYRGCYLVVNAVFQYEDEDDQIILQSDLRVAHSIDDVRKWSIEGAFSRERFGSKQEAIQVIENEELADGIIVWLSSEKTRARYQNPRSRYSVSMR